MTGEAQLTITPPFGYGEIVALQRTDRVLMPRGATPEFCRGVNALAVSAAEFTAASRDYPIAFASSDGAAFAPVVLVGLGENQNLFVDENGAWDSTCYVPAYVRRYPFCLARVIDDVNRGGDRVVCVEKSYIDAGGLSLYNDTGEPTGEWAGFEQLLRAYEADLELTGQMCEAFAKLGLFEPFEFKVMQGEAAALTLKGVYRIEEQRFTALRPASHKALVTKGFMGRVYTHFNSLENFTRLYQRALLRAAADAKRQKNAIQR